MNLSRTKREAKGARCMQEKRRRQEADRGSEGNGSGGEVDPAAFRRGAPRANHRTRRRRGSSTSTKPSSRPPLPFRPSPRAARRRGSECGAQESEAAGGAIGPNPRDTTERRQRQNRGGPSSTGRTTRAENQAQRRAPPSNTHRCHVSGVRTRSAVECARFLLYRD